jgi:hypothetical protein
MDPIDRASASQPGAPGNHSLSEYEHFHAKQHRSESIRVLWVLRQNLESLFRERLKALPTPDLQVGQGPGERKRLSIRVANGPD